MLLTSSDTVRVVVRSSFPGLIQGELEALHLYGANWRSKLGLRARELTISIPGRANLDYGKLIGGRVSLTEPARGWAEAVFDADDFRDFLLYPRVTPPRVGGEIVDFARKDVSLDVDARRIVFHGKHSGAELSFALQAAEDGTVNALVVDGGAATSEQKEALAAGVTRFFRTLSVDLAGINLTFSEIRLEHRGSLGDGRAHGVVRVLLAAEIRKMPNPAHDEI